MQNVIDLATKLVAFETVSAASNMQMALDLQGLFLELGFAVELQKKVFSPEKKENGENRKLAEKLGKVIDDLGFSIKMEEKQAPGVEKANLIARIGPRDVEPLMLSAHMDVVSPGDEEWKTKPFVLTEKGDKLYGRGSADMKGPLAALICGVEPLLQSQAAMRRELIFGLTFDEEVGLIGARHMEAESESGRNVLRPRFILVAEPTELVPMRIHKGHLCLRAICHGQTAHGSRPDEGANAIELASQVISILQKFRDDELKGEQDSCIRPPYATLNIGIIEGGSKYNIVPADCEIDFEIRTIPGQSASGIIVDLRCRMEAIGWDDLGKPKVELELQELGETRESRRLRRTRSAKGLQLGPHRPKKDPTEPVSTSADSLLVKVAEKVTGRTAAGASFSTDATILQHLGGECLILGPGSINQAHTKNEFIKTKQLLLAVEQFREIVRQICFEGVG